MKHGIGLAAGKVWAYLNENGETPTSAIAGKTALTATEVQRAIGWLAREDKIEISKAKRTETIRLR
jgi:hypothetical protein